MAICGALKDKGSLVCPRSAFDPPPLVTPRGDIYEIMGASATIDGHSVVPHHASTTKSQILGYSEKWLLHSPVLKCDAYGAVSLSGARDGDQRPFMRCHGHRFFVLDPIYVPLQDWRQGAIAHILGIREMFQGSEVPPQPAAVA